MRHERFDRGADHAAIVLKSIANKWRLLILYELVKGEKSVGELLELIEIGPSSLSQHLAVLRANGLVKTRRDAQVIYYSLRESDVPGILMSLHSLFVRPSEGTQNVQARRRQR